MSNPVEGDVVDLSQGFPGTAPHQSVLDALSEAAKQSDVAKYGPIIGHPGLREAIAEEMRVLYRLPTTPTTPAPYTDQSAARGVMGLDVAITVGGNMAFLAILMALCPPHTSSVLLPIPAYFSHTMSISLQSVKPVHLACDPANDFQPSLSATREYLLSPDRASDPVKPRMILLINPSNPTGSIMPTETLREWYNLAKECKIALVVDETYRDFVVGENDGVRGVPHRLFEEKAWRSTFISLGSFSSMSVFVFRTIDGFAHIIKKATGYQDIVSAQSLPVRSCLNAWKRYAIACRYVLRPIGHARFSPAHMI